jgi:hypothetical protein
VPFPFALLYISDIAVLSSIVYADGKLHAYHSLSRRFILFSHLVNYHNVTGNTFTKSRSNMKRMTVGTEVESITNLHIPGRLNAYLY